MSGTWINYRSNAGKLQYNRLPHKRRRPHARVYVGALTHVQRPANFDPSIPVPLEGEQVSRSCCGGQTNAPARRLGRSRLRPGAAARAVLNHFYDKPLANILSARQRWRHIASCGELQVLAVGNIKGADTGVLAVYSIQADFLAVGERECQDRTADGVNGQDSWSQSSLTSMLRAHFSGSSIC